MAAAKEAKRQARKLPGEERRNAETASASVPDLEEVFIELEGDRDIPF
jgi:hypothetical protein